MRTVSIRLEDLKKLTIPIGFVGENQYTQVRIDSSIIYDEYPNATPGLTVTPPIGDPYPATVTRDGAIVIWNVDASDLTNDGSGEIQLSFIVDEMVAKSYKGRINILGSIIPSGTTPTPIANWIEYAQAVLGMFTEMTAEAETLPEGSDATVELTDENGHKVLLVGIPKGDTGEQGEPGADGYSPIVSVEDITGGHRVTITDVNGSHVFEVMDGEDGQDGYSPTVSVFNITGGHRITITDKNGTKVVDVMDGVQGEPGDDGYSPTATVTKNGSTATITVTDKNGTTTASVSDGDPTTLIDDASTAQNKVWSAKKSDSEVGSIKSQISQKQDAPETAGTAGQVLSLDSNLDPVWVNQSGGGSFDGEFTLDLTNQSASLGEELASGTGWVLGTGWTGDFTNGFTHSSGTDALEFPITGNESGKMYLVSFTSTVDATATPNFYVTIGDSDLFPLYGMPQPYRVGIISKGTANLKFIPVTSFTGKIADVSIKEVTQISVPYMLTVDTSDNNVIEYRSSNNQLGCIFIGRKSGQWNVTGFGNTAVGDETLIKNIGGFWNTAMGITALRDNETGSRNVGVGYGALQANIAGCRNIAIGTFSLITNKTGYQNVAVGADSMDKNTTGYNNVALGFQAMYNNTTGYENVAIGNNTAGNLTTGYRNIIIGQRTLGSITNQNYNIGMGYSVMPNTTGSYNVGIGMNTLYYNTGGQYNVAIGFQAGQGSNSASQTRNVFIGAQAGLNVYNSVNNNVLIGYQAGSTLVKGSENVCIGHSADVPNSNTDNYTNINGQVKGSKVSGSEWTEVLGNLIVMGTDGVRRQIVFNNDNSISWQTAT